MKEESTKLNELVKVYRVRTEKGLGQNFEEQQLLRGRAEEKALAQRRVRNDQRHGRNIWKRAESLKPRKNYSDGRESSAVNRLSRCHVK